MREVAVGQQHVQEESFEELMQRLRINAPSSTMCKHGYPPTLSTGEEKICLDFISAYLAAFRSHDKDLRKAFLTAKQATEVAYVDVYSSKLETVASKLVAAGTDAILGGDIWTAQLYVVMACHFEEFISVGVALINWVKVTELFDADEHTLVKYFRKRIPCHCLDKKYKEVKSVKKVGMCCNPNCSVRKVERSKMFCCTGCGAANYCSKECQKENWKSHKEFCGDIAEKKAAFQAKQS